MKDEGRSREVRKLTPDERSGQCADLLYGWHAVLFRSKSLRSASPTTTPTTSTPYALQELILAIETSRLQLLTEDLVHMDV